MILKRNEKITMKIASETFEAWRTTKLTKDSFNFHIGY
ncbi:acyl carrier protein [Streptococcus ruminantium]|uniref:Acyl carrier protein n=1 Tax=Streptococcus ruminantium TaxID=1917441 RepID=A0A2Z5TXD5_9STRE|nr:acyl carrier protein [Streptococcus ruminantium]